MRSVGRLLAAESSQQQHQRTLVDTQAEGGVALQVAVEGRVELLVAVGGRVVLRFAVGGGVDLHFAVGGRVDLLAAVGSRGHPRVARVLLWSPFLYCSCKQSR